MISKRRHKGISVIGAVIACAFFLCVSGCGLDTQQSDQSQNEPVETGFVIPKPGTFDSEDSAAVITKLDKKAKTITFYNQSVNRKYTLNYDGVSRLYDKYGSAIVIDQITVGDVVDVKFLKSKKLLTDLMISPDVWVYTGVKDYAIDTLTKNISIKDSMYRYGDSTLIYSDGEAITIMDINECDELTVRGKDHDIVSISIDKGHGYIRLKGEDSFIDGWIEIGGEKIIKTITENMLLAVPIGTYEVSLSKGNYKTVETVTIERNKETLLDLTESSKEIDDNSYGDVIFVTDPEDSILYVDGKETDKSGAVTLEYGIHQMIVKAEGYETLTQYIKVGQKSATIEAVLDKKEGSKDDKDTSSVPTPQVTTFVTPSVITADTSSYFVNIESPEGAEVYVDGNYIGIVPTKFSKVTGTHVVTLRKEGYQTRSYTISLDSLLQNESFSFSLLAENKPTEAVEEETDNSDEESEE